MTEIAVHGLLTRQSALRRAGAKGRAGDGPGSARQPRIIRFLEIRQQNVLTMDGRNSNQKKQQGNKVEKGSSHKIWGHEILLLRQNAIEAGSVCQP